MTQTIQNVIIAAVAGLVASLVVLHFAPSKVMQATGTPVGSTFNTAKVAMINWTFAAVTGANGVATTTSVFNGDSSDRIIQAVQFDCSAVGTSNTAYTGAGLRSLILKAATTSTSAPNIVSNTNVVFSSDIATTSADVYLATTTPGLTGTVPFRRWASGSYLSFFSNATNTAACTIGVTYFGT